MATNRQGMAQLATWISTESMARLKTLAHRDNASIREIIERAIGGYAGHRPATPATADDRIAELETALTDHESRLAALETRQQLDIELDAVLANPADSDPTESTAMDTALDTQLDNEPDTALEEVIAILARQGLKPQAIANELERLGHRTKSGNVIRRGDSRIARALKTLSSRKLD